VSTDKRLLGKHFVYKLKRGEGAQFAVKRKHPVVNKEIQRHKTIVQNVRFSCVRGIVLKYFTLVQPTKVSSFVTIYTHVCMQATKSFCYYKLLGLYVKDITNY